MSRKLSRRAIAKIFDSSRPVKSRSELFGRRQEIDALLSAVLDSGQHAIVHGARGSGKTSLVKIFGDFADQKGAIVLYLPCEPGASFADLMRGFLYDLPDAAIDAAMRQAYTVKKELIPKDFGPRIFAYLVENLFQQPTIFVLDEFDRINDPQVKADIAITMKLLSDADSNLVFMLVGIAQSVNEVIEAHPSLRRHVKTLRLDRIDESSVSALINRGCSVAGIDVTPDARAAIIRAACGSPYHVRLFCHQAILSAVRTDHPKVEASDVIDGLHLAMEHWAGMNEADSRQIEWVIDSGCDLDRLESLARTLAVSDQLTEFAEYQDLIDALGQALTVAPVRVRSEIVSCLTFSDSLAPQFVIAGIMAKQASGAFKPETGVQDEYAVNT